MSRRARTRAAATAVKRMYLDRTEPLREDDGVDRDDDDSGDWYPGMYEGEDHQEERQHL